jgi:hypothetical protein
MMQNVVINWNVSYARSAIGVSQSNQRYSGSAELVWTISSHTSLFLSFKMLTFDFYMIEAKPEKLIGDKAYDSDILDAELAKDGIEMIAPHRGNRCKDKTQDGRKLRRYSR